MSGKAGRQRAVTRRVVAGQAGWREGWGGGQGGMGAHWGIGSDGGPGLLAGRGGEGGGGRVVAGGWIFGVPE